MFDALRRLMGSGKPAPRAAHPRLSVDAWPEALYAIGDIHGCVEELRDLERQIDEDCADIEGEVWVVYLGDFVDRGPNSAEVLDRLLSRAPGKFKRICLTGNHEVMMLDYLADPRADADWLKFGGLETLMSYGVSPGNYPTNAKAIRNLLDSHIPQDHVDFMSGLAISLTLPGMVLVHAGLKPGIPLDRQVETDLLWIRDEFFEAPPREDLTVVHGHTPGREPVVTQGRICLDTGVFATGRLTAARLWPDRPPQFFTGRARGNKPTQS